MEKEKSMSISQLLLIAGVAEVAGEIAHIVWVMARGESWIFSSGSSGTGRKSATRLVKAFKVGCLLNKEAKS
jgi:hypothetical protein